ncbi:hypothetical protein J8Z24_21640 (plasmid) [Pseudoalteromonas sp. SCSIO 43201]|uniref:hypothetical protein n=1 Tax=Pseudoalteromonas sp. SCSIO 43201 TaxID=2822842 RepID=UPI002075D1FC|nr:hypothetical protein [Pseudoalteromonas sp. SCSIO 43201]USD31115.1 hypothetical protein J8Z24_21640 [Pseudoalteromonas sp. SCSIO 43201]
MSQDLIQPDSFSYEQILNDLTGKLEEKYSETDGAWRDFYKFGTGQIILELLSAVGSFTTYSALANRREAYLHETHLESSARAIAGPLGYSAYRGSNVSLRLSIYTSSVTTIKKFDKVGEYEDESGVYDLLSLGDYTISPPSSENALPTQIDVAIGQLATTSIILPTSKPQVFRFTEENVSEHFELKLNNKAVPHSEDVIDLINGKYVCITNTVGSIDVMAINDYLADTDKFRAGYELSLLYIQLHENKRVQLTNINLEVGTLENVAIASRYQAPDTVGEIQVKGPLRHETGRVIRGRHDYMKRITEVLPNAIDVRAKDLDSAKQMIAYIIDTEQPLTEAEKENVIAQVAPEENRPMGVTPPVLVSGRVVEVILEVQIIPKKGNQLPSSIDIDVLQSLAQFENRLGLKLDSFDVESAILADLPYAKAVRIEVLPAPDISDEELEQWQPLNIAWSEYFKFMPRVSLYDSSKSFEATSGPAQR